MTDADFQNKLLLFLLSWRGTNEMALPGSMARELTTALCTFTQYKEAPSGNEESPAP
jgi:hypothetical protein